MAAVALQGTRYHFNPLPFPSANTIEESIRRVAEKIMYNDASITIHNIEFDTGAKEWSVAHFISPIIPHKEACDSLKSFSQTMALAGAVLVGLVALALAYVGWSIILIGMGSAGLFFALIGYYSLHEPEDLQENAWMQKKWCDRRVAWYNSIVPSQVNMKNIIENIETRDQRLFVPNDVVVIHYMAMGALREMQHTQLEVASELGARSPKPLALISSRVTELKDPRIEATYRAFFPNIQWPTQENPDEWIEAYFKAVGSPF